ncbi:MAG TPA: S41 family peptidase [Candidatus Aerophobetes bacterium]|uniref:S41 family peptidase n=1 Tax=Aerophobetes bacterium TaxID=2030807 RepID=A0A7V5HYW5_UNCAE|nr:S41 family peptidase [Candidatus Aerophobetes bacterium]
MSKTFKRKIFLTLSVVLTLIFTLLMVKVQAESDFLSEIRLIIQVYQIIQNEYIEKVNPSKLIEGAIKGMVETLGDPHSRWLTAEEWKEWSVEKKGKFGGLGMVVGIRDGFITVVDPLEDTPASRAGLKPGDKIIKINGESTEGMTLNQAVEKMRGEVGTQVRLTIKREGVPELLEYTITRELITLPNIKKRIFGDTGYIKIIGFTNENTSKELRETLSSLKASGVKTLILDLRDNPGGLLSQAVEVADEFLSSGTIVSIRGRDPAESNIYSAHPGGEGIEFPLVVLINEASASASEIVAGAIKDHKRGILVGTKTFGKGTVQNAIPLENGGALWLTTAKYYTPSGICIEGQGIKPDIEIRPFTPTSEEKKIMEEAKNSEEVKEFLELNPEWEGKDLKPLLNKLEKKGIKISKELLERVLREKDKNKENDVFNDNQLVQAINLLKSLPVLEQKKLEEKETVSF